MTLATVQQAALDRLVALLTYATTGVRQVNPDFPDSLNALPELVLVDQGMQVVRSGYWREIEWDVEFQCFVQKTDQARSLKAAREIRANLIDRLDTDLTLAGTVSRTTWKSPLRVTALELGDVEYAGVVGLYTLWLQEGVAFG